MNTSQANKADSNPLTPGAKVIRRAFWNAPEVDWRGTVLENLGQTCRVLWEDGRISMVANLTLGVCS